MSVFAGSLWIYLYCIPSWLIGLALMVWYGLSRSANEPKLWLAIFMVLESSAALATAIAPSIQKEPMAVLALTGFLVLISITALGLPGMITWRDWKALGWYATHLCFIGGISTKLAIFSGYLAFETHVLADVLLIVGIAAAICWYRMNMHRA